MEFNSGVSETVPDQGSDVRQILIAHAKGVQLDKAFDPVYLGEDQEFPNPRTLDLTELQAMKSQVNDVFSRYEKDKKTWEDRREKKRIDDLVNSEMKKRLDGIPAAEKKEPKGSSTNPS